MNESLLLERVLSKNGKDEILFWTQTQRWELYDNNEGLSHYAVEYLFVSIEIPSCQSNHMPKLIWCDFKNAWFLSLSLKFWVVHFSMIRGLELFSPQSCTFWSYFKAWLYFVLSDSFHVCHHTKLVRARFSFILTWGARWRYSDINKFKMLALTKAEPIMNLLSLLPYSTWTLLYLWEMAHNWNYYDFQMKEN